MKHGDISNVEAGRLWFVAEGLVLLPVKCGKTHRSVKNSYVLNSWVYKRMWDLAWRLDFRLSIVTFNTNEKWLEMLVEYIDDADIPAPVHAYEVDNFKDMIVPLPSCLRVFDADLKRALSFGSKGVHVDSAYDFEPFQ